MKNSVYFTIHLGEKGFSFIHVFLSLLLVSSTLILLPSIYQFLEQRSMTDEHSIRQFFHMLNDEIQTHSFEYHTNTSFHLTDQHGQKIVISLYGNVIRRQVNQTGHEIMVRNIKELTISTVTNGIHVTIKSITGDSYAKTIATY